MARLAEQDVLRQLADLSADTKGLFWVAYSGGLDSQVLLHLSQKALPSAQLRAIHINHGLSPNSQAWQEHCQQYCEQLNIDFECRKVEIANTNSNLESQARHARYAVFESLIKKEDCILMAHHQDDQMETVLYRLLRGSGPKGLAGIPVKRKISRGNLLRPLLSYSKDELTEFAKHEGLSWIEDESNSDISFDRNFLRQSIIPSLKSRWPSAGKSIQRSAELLAESEQLLQTLAMLDAGDLIAENKTAFPLELMHSKDMARQRNLLRYWFQNLNENHGIPMPGFEELRCIVEEVIPSAADSQPLISWNQGGISVDLRRFANKLYVLKNFPVEIDKTALTIKAGVTLALGSNLGSIRLEETTSGGVRFQAGDEFEIRFSCASSEAKPAGRKTRSFKKIFQDYAVPPWLRSRIPLLFVNGELAAVADLFVCHDMAEKKGEKQLRINWQRADVYCGY
jgi:tRNA(Ile)-lysidine synthase